MQTKPLSKATNEVLSRSTFFKNEDFDEVHISIIKIYVFKMYTSNISIFSRVHQIFIGFPILSVKMFYFIYYRMTVTVKNYLS